MVPCRAEGRAGSQAAAVRPRWGCGERAGAVWRCGGASPPAGVRAGGGVVGADGTQCEGEQIKVLKCLQNASFLLVWFHARGAEAVESVWPVGVGWAGRPAADVPGGTMASGPATGSPAAAGSVSVGVCEPERRRLRSAAAISL